jgi:UDP-N-acetylglucosamine--N-acetylmuramyl-(pentapeptide) pyrophosphoryl-undecaprenol N-acetylglucosamine transferase
LRKNIAITGGGTGGHLKIAKVIKEELNKRGINPVYIGSTNGADQKWFMNDKGFCEKYFLQSSGVVNKKGFGKIDSLLHILKLSIQTKQILKKHNIQAVFSVGGYSAAPASFAALFTKTPLYIHEQNAHIGTLNKILKPFSKRFFNTFFYNDPYPVEDIFFQKAKIRTRLNTIIFLGGSQGAREINKLAMEMAPTLAEKKINIIHQTGSNDFEKVNNFYLENKIKADVFAFDQNLADKISKADLAISRAGASTLFELAANQIPAIYIPYPYAAGDHQFYNARYMSDKKLGFVLRNPKSGDIFDIIEKMDLEKISKNLSQINRPQGARIIADAILGG